MRFTSASLLLLLLAISLSSIEGFLESYYTNLKCKCVGQPYNSLNLRSIKRIQILRAGSGCPNTEVIVWRKNNSTLCVNPDTKWFQELLKLLQKENRHRQVLPNPGSKRST